MKNIERLAEVIIFIASCDDFNEIGKVLAGAYDEGIISEEDAITLSSKYSSLAMNRLLKAKEIGK